MDFRGHIYDYAQHGAPPDLGPGQGTLSKAGHTSELVHSMSSSYYVLG